jgi:Family of unknown function (DUF6636)
MLRTIVISVMALAGTTVPAQAAPELARFVRFQTPSRNVGCIYSPSLDRRPAYLRCDILSGLKPVPRGTCELDWTGYTILARMPPRPTCAGDTVYDRRARILRYGTTWRQGAFACRSLRTGLRCTNAAGRGFVLARARSSTF